MHVLIIVLLALALLIAAACVIASGRPRSSRPDIGVDDSAPTGPDSSGSDPAAEAPIPPVEARSTSRVEPS